MEVYLGKDRKYATTDMTAAHATVKQLTRAAKGHDHKLYMDNCFFFSSILFNFIQIHNKTPFLISFF